MILKGSQRGHGSDLATHLCNEFDNDMIELAQVRGTVASDLHGAFAEIEAIASGTKATQPLFSLSINPSAPLDRAQYHEAIDRIEERLGLSGQPRAIIFHHKKGGDGVVREHAHVVWSRIDAQNMRAIPMSHFKAKLCDLACELAHRFGHELPPGLKAWEEKQKFEKDKLESNLAENAQAALSGTSPEERRETITACYESTDNAAAFRAALEENGYILARGDRRGYVVVDGDGHVHSLSRYVKGTRAKDIAQKLTALPPDQLPSVDDAKTQVAARMEALADRQREQQDKHQEREAKLAQQEHALRQKLDALHRKRRDALQKNSRDMAGRHADERLLLAAAHVQQQTRLGFRVRSAVADLIDRSPGLRSVLGPLQRATGLDPRERQERECVRLPRGTSARNWKSAAVKLRFPRSKRAKNADLKPR